MIDDAIRANGGLIGRRPAELMDPWAAALVLAIPGYSLTPVTSGTTSNLTTHLQSNFASGVSPWVGQNATIAAVSGELQVNPTSAFQGARWTVAGLTAGLTLTISGKVRVPDSGNSAAVNAWDRSGYASILNQSYSAATQTSFSLTATVPASGSIDVGLTGAQTSKSVYFDDITITTGSGNSTTVVSGMPATDLTGRTLTWTGGAIIDNAVSKFYGQSMAFAGTDRVSAVIPALATSDFIIDGFAYFTGGSNQNRGVFRAFAGALALETDSQGGWSVVDGGTAHSGPAGSAWLNTWAHFRISRVGNTLGFLIAGSLIQFWTTAANLTDGTFVAGCAGDANFSKPLAGRLQDIRVYRGIGSLETYSPLQVPYAHRARRYPSIITRI